MLFAALQPTWTGQRSYVPPQSCLCPIFPHTKPFEASPCLDELGYSGHSTRGASTSAAAAVGLSVEFILEGAPWASAQTFERFYHREQSRGAFARAVLAVRLIFDFCLYCRISLLFTVLGFVILQSMPPEDAIKLS